MSDKPVPMDLAPYAHAIEGSAEFLRMWAKPDGPVTCFINPAALGADPALFGMALVDAIHHAAITYARAVQIPEAHALERIWQGLDAERQNPTDIATPLASKQELN